MEMCGSVSVGRETYESRYAEHRLACHSRSLEADFTATFFRISLQFCKAFFHFSRAFCFRRPS